MKAWTNVKAKSTRNTLKHFSIMTELDSLPYIDASIDDPAVKAMVCVIDIYIYRVVLAPCASAPRPNVSHRRSRHLLRRRRHDISRHCVST